MININQKYGGLKLVWHPEKLVSLRNGVVTAPIGVRVKPINRCNHQCFYCSYDPEVEDVNILSEGFRRGDQIPREKLLEILDDFRDMGVKAITYSGGGEPLIYPHIEEAFQRTLDNGIDLSIITNGQNLYGKKAELLRGAKWVRISLDTCKEDTFQQTRKVSKKLFGRLEENIRAFVEANDQSCELGINFVVHHLNHREVYEAAEYFKGLGVNHVKFTPRWIDKKGKWEKYHSPFKENVIAQIAEARRLESDSFAIFDTYENDFNLTGVQNRTYDTCPIMQIVPVIGADSVVYFCHDKTYLKEGGDLGSLKDQSFKDLWFSPEAAEKFKTFNPQVECQQHCTYDSRNILIKDAIASYSKDHVNFP